MSDEHMDFFKKTEDYHVVLTFYGSQYSVSIEELYQHLKARLLAETKTKEVDREWEEDEGW